MKQSDVPGQHHFARHIPRGRVVADADGGEQLTPDAIRIRPVDEGELSGAWWELCDCPDDVRRQSLLAEWRSGGRGIKERDRIALANVDRIKEIGVRHDRRLRVRHEPEALSPSYAKVKAINEDDLELLEALAREAFGRLVSCD